MEDLFPQSNQQAISLTQHLGSLTCYPGWLSPSESRQYFQLFYKELAWKTETLLMAGKKMQSPRLVAWYGDEGEIYRYSGTRYKALPWHPALHKIKEKLNSEFSAPINSVLTNLYRNGKDSVGWHADSEIELGKQPIIFSLSLGASRYFDYRLQGKSESKQRIELHAGTLLIMQGNFQQYWQHQVPKQLKITEPRINLTFRYINKANKQNK
ncbi:MAG: alpha-ketoglutarate-dependent dioxygenase AlkB [SAR86 cluster bacterium]|uniref:Alpha-ketoglutarate-dependent dioxygenase AlkB n=1 Tax=SAR86 cluster bacterium TaxID=2030880 RepID=A0A2A5CG03_9GAMM|nr:MAG: alpha-ketoglutarate-dependent dioxygenase AlkB [SAR86 cluster bacterium]